MRYQARSSSEQKTTGIQKMAYLTFSLFIFFSFFGIDIPFNDAATDVADFGDSSNVRRQVIFSSLFLSSICCLIPIRKKIATLIMREKFLTIFFFWCAISIAWSDYSFVTFKRWIQLATTITVCTAFLLHLKSPDDALKYFKTILMLYVLVTLASIVVMPGAWDPKTMGAWRGLAHSKNNLGQAALVCLIIFAIAIQTSTGKDKILALIFWGLSFVLLMGSKSTTVLIVLIFIIPIVTMLFIERRLATIGIGKIFLFVMMCLGVGLIATVFYLQDNVIDVFFGLFGKDSTFTDRIFLWEDILEISSNHFLLGTGYQSFWILESPDVLKLYEKYVWLPLQAHEGYIDLLNEVGFIGFIVFVFMVASYFKNLALLGEPHAWKWMIIATLIVNLTESTLFRLGNVQGVMFTFSYLLLFTKIIHKPEPVNSEALARKNALNQTIAEAEASFTGARDLMTR